MNWAADQRKAWDMPHFLRCLAAGGGIALLYGLILGTGTLRVRAADSLFFGGLAVFLYGICRAISSLGFFDLPAFAFRKLGQTLRAQKRGGDEETVSTERLTTYAEYLTRPKPHPSCKEALSAGAAYLALCAGVLLLFP